MQSHCRRRASPRSPRPPVPHGSSSEGICPARSPRRSGRRETAALTLLRLAVRSAPGSRLPSVRYRDPWLPPAAGVPFPLRARPRSTGRRSRTDRPTVRGARPDRHSRRRLLLPSWRASGVAFALLRTPRSAAGPSPDLRTRAVAIGDPMGHGDSLSLDARIEPLTYAEPDALDGPQCPSIEAVREPLDPWWPAHPAPARAGIRGRSLAPWALHARPAVPAPIAAHGPSRGV